ncbi:SRPBCC family protein [Mycolicibacterium cosmeticum]|uniref:SRPBCC family protein n=1 Tax=Mycolicibacterium cosmeticum TaxID=258533 RepID=UPI0032049708
MIDISRTIPLDDGLEPALTVDDVWSGLVEKAENPLPYVAAISACTVVERFEGGLVRDIEHVGPVREVVTFYPKKLVHFVRTHGSARGTIDNEICIDEAGNDVLKFSFRLVVDGVAEGSAEEAAFGEQMQSDYLDAVHTTLQAVRERIVNAGTSVLS